MRFVTRNLRIRYPAQEHWAINQVNIEVRPGQITWLSGALGSGASTLLLGLAGLTPRITGGERDGTVVADDSDTATLEPLKAGIAYLGAIPALQISGIAKTVRDEVAVGPMNLGQSCDQIVTVVADAMHRLRITHLADRAPGVLSGGETQRVLLAALYATAPRAWLLDEPFSALDRVSALQVQCLLRELANAGATIVVACDDADAMLETADRLIVLQAGRVVLDGEPRLLLASDAIIASGAGTTDAASLAWEAGLPAPRPLTRTDLLQQVASMHDHGGSIGCAIAAPVHRPTGGACGAADPSPSPVEPVAELPSPAVDPALEMTSVVFAYPGSGHVLDNATFRLCRGEAVGLFGANGAGKSTLLRLAMALEHPGGGVVRTLGKVTYGVYPENLAPRVGFLFQQPERQLFKASVRAECAIAPRLAGWSASRIHASVTATLKELGLSDTADEHPYDLPLPRRRLVALAAILTADPELILLDEPTAALDAASRERVIRVIRERARRGQTVLAITHDPVFAHEALIRAMLLEHGCVVQDGPVRSVIEDHRMLQPAALAVALALGIPAGEDRRADIARTIRSR